MSQKNQQKSSKKNTNFEKETRNFLKNPKKKKDPNSSKKIPEKFPPQKKMSIKISQKLLKKNPEIFKKNLQKFPKMFTKLLVYGEAVGVGELGPDISRIVSPKCS